MNKNIKLFGMALLAGAAITSCSNEDDVTNLDDTYLSRNGITFSSSKSPQLTTKATPSWVSPYYSALESFSIDILPNSADNLGETSQTFMVKDHTFTKGADGVYTSNPQYFWPTTGTLNFYAISPYDATTRSTSTSSDRTVKKWDGTADLMAAVSIESKKEGRDANKAYPLTFKHITSDVTAKFKAADETKDLTYVIKSLTMTAPNSGTYTFGSETGSFGSWSIPTESLGTYNYFATNTSSLTFVNRTTDNVKATANVADDYYILPTTDGTLTFTVEYEVYQSGKKILSFTTSEGTAKTVEVTKASLEMGKRYTYVLALPASEADPITFTVNKVDFEETVEKDVTIPNNVTINGHKFIDLGLPSGTLWAETNVGATTAADYGNYYAWGETKTKTTYNSDTYECTLNTTILPPSCDAATVNWNSPCRMPTVDDFQELIDNCTREKASQTNSSGSIISGEKFTSKTNGESIFLPLAGEYLEGNLSGAARNGQYWSSSLSSKNSKEAFYLQFGDPGGATYLSPSTYDAIRAYGFSVRPIAIQ